MVAPETAAPTIEVLEAENTRLRARIDALEAHQARAPRRNAGTSERKHSGILGDETEGILKDLGDSSRDTLDRIARGLVFAWVESIDATSDAINAAAQTAFSERAERGTARAAEDGEGGIQASTKDLVASLASGLRLALDGPERVVSRFLDAYGEEKPITKRRGRRPASGKA